MRIDRLNLIAFGKFQNKRLDFKDGINIIYAENEGGKTTIHRFMDGMFYGFLKAYVKSIIYLPEHKKYEPWNSNSYKGVLNLQIDEEDYRIERTFTKGMEDTKVVLENTGEDITYKINTGERSRIPQPGYHFFGFNSGIYSNTVSISQLGIATDEKLANEVRDKLVNISSTMDEKVSIEKAVKDLDSRIKEIGSIKASTSSYGIASAEILGLKERKAEIHKKHHIYEELLQDKSSLQLELSELTKKLEATKSQEKIVEYRKMKSIYTEALREIKNIKDLKSKIDKYSEFKDLSNEDYLAGLEVLHDINIINSRIDDSNNQLTDIKENMHHLLSSKMTFDEVKAKQIFDDYFDYEAINEEIIKLEKPNKDRDIEFIKRDIKDLRDAINRYSLLIIVMFITYGISMYFSISNKPILILLQISWIFIGLNIKKVRGLKKDISSILHHQNELEKEENFRKEDLNNIQVTANAILARNNCSGKTELREKYQKVLEAKYRFDEEKRSIEANILSISTLNNKIQELSLKKQAMEDELKEILIKNYSESLEVFKLGLSYKDIYEDLSIEYRNRQEILTKILGNLELEELKKDLEDNIHLDIEPELTREALETSLEDLNQSISNLNLENKKLQTQIDGLTPEISSLVNIEEELIRKIKLLEEMDEKRESLDLAKSTILKLSSEIHTQFAPHINERVGITLSRITGDKYSSVRIDDRLNMGVIDPITGEIININSLSGGTIDQLYFSLRFGIINSISDKKLPLILDDPFIQYDDNRLRNILNLLINISDQRQIILFSCQKREINILREMNIDVNLITLS